MADYYNVRDICKWKDGPTTIRSGRYEDMDEALTVAQQSRVNYEDILKTDWTEIAGYSISVEEVSGMNMITIALMEGGTW